MAGLSAGLLLVSLLFLPFSLRAQSATGNPYLFQGARYDVETGFYYFRHRHYDPRAGRFLQRDPVWDAQNVGGWYAFVGNGPVARFDPLGQSDEQSCPPEEDGDRAWREAWARKNPFLQEKIKEYAEAVQRALRAGTSGTAGRQWQEVRRAAKRVEFKYLLGPKLLEEFERYEAEFDIQRTALEQKLVEPSLRISTLMWDIFRKESELSRCRSSTEEEDLEEEIHSLERQIESEWRRSAPLRDALSKLWAEYSEKRRKYFGDESPASREGASEEQPAEEQGSSAEIDEVIP